MSLIDREWNNLKILREQPYGPDELDAVDPVALDHLPLQGTVEVDPPVDLHIHPGDPRDPREDPRVQNDHPGVPSPDPTVLAQQLHGLLDAVVLQMCGVDVIYIYCTLLLTRGVIIPVSESILEPELHHFSEIGDSDSDYRSRNKWNHNT